MRGLAGRDKTDKRIVLFLEYAAKLGYRLAVVRTPDTDIFVDLLFYANIIGLTIFLVIVRLST